MKKRFLSKVLLLLLSIVMMFTLLVACNPEDEKVPDPTPTPPTMQDYLGEVGAAMDKALSINAGKPFNLDLMVNPKFEFADKSKEQYNWDYSVKLKGNLNFAETIEEGKKRANELDFAVVNNTTDVTLFALALDGEYAYVTVGEEKLKFSSFDFYSAIRAYTGIIFDKESSLAEADIALAELLPLLGGQLFTSYTKTEVAGGFDYKFNFNLKTAWDKIIGVVVGMLPADININALLAQLLNCPEDKVAESLPNFNADIIFNVENGEMVGIDLIPAKIDIGTFNLDTKLKCNPGINASFKLDKVRADFANIEAVKLLNINMSGTINLVNKTNPTNSFYTMNWKLVANMDPMLLVQEKFNLDSDVLKDNFFHFQLSHICNDICKADYCKDRVRNNNGVIKDDGPGSLLDIAFAPASFVNGGLGNSNINITFDPYGLLSRNFLIKLLADLNVVVSDADLNALKLLTNYDGWLQLNPAALLEGKDDLSTTSGEGGGTTVPGLGSINIDSIKGIFESLSNMITMDKQGISIDLKGLEAVIGDAPVIGSKSIANIISLFLDGKSEECKTDKIIIAGDEGIGSQVFIDLFDPILKDYNVYEEVILLADRDKNISHSYNSGNAVSVKPELEKKEDGTVQLYTDAKGAKYEGKLSKTSIKEITNYFVKYTYTNLAGKESQGYIKIVGTSGLDTASVGKQNIKLLTSFTEGVGFLNRLNSTLRTFVKGVEIDLSSLPIAAAMFKDVNIELVEETNFEVDKMDKKEYSIGEAIDLSATATITYKDGTTASITATGYINGGVDGSNVANKAGKYKITYYFAGRNVVKEITIAESKFIKYVPVASKAELGTAIDTIDFGNVVYTLADASIVEYKISADMVTFENGIVQNGKLVKVGKTKYTVNHNGLVFGNNIFNVEAIKSTYSVSYDNNKEILSFTNIILGHVGQKIEFTANTANLNGEAITDELVKKTFKINGEDWSATSISLPANVAKFTVANILYDFSDDTYQNLTKDSVIEFKLGWKMEDGSTGTTIITKNITLSKFAMTVVTNDFSKADVTFKYTPGVQAKKLTNTFKWKFEDFLNQGLTLFLVTITKDADGKETREETAITADSNITATIDSGVSTSIVYNFIIKGLADSKESQYKLSCVDGDKEIYAHTTAKTKVTADSYTPEMTANPLIKPSFRITYKKGNNGKTVSYENLYLRLKMFVNGTETTQYEGKEVYFKYSINSSKFDTPLTVAFDLKASTFLNMCAYYMDGDTEKIVESMVNVTYKGEVYSKEGDIETVILTASK